MSIYTIMAVLVLHFLGDFLLQSDWMALNKSKQYGFNIPMATHIGIYGMCLSPFGASFVLINMAAHFITDAITSNITKYLWIKNQRHWFFVVIGFDQLLHYTVLFLTLGN